MTATLPNVIQKARPGLRISLTIGHFVDPQRGSSDLYHRSRTQAGLILKSNPRIPSVRSTNEILTEQQPVAIINLIDHERCVDGGRSQAVNAVS